MDNDEKFDIKKLPRLEIIKPIDEMLRWFLMLIFIVVPEQLQPGFQNIVKTCMDLRLFPMPSWMLK